MRDAKPPQFEVRGEASKPEKVSLSGEFVIRMQRWVRAFMGYDLTQEPQGYFAGLDRNVAMRAIVANLDAPPFRSLGRGFSCLVRVAAGAQFSQARVSNVSKEIGDIAIIDWIDVNGGSTEWQYGFCNANFAPGAPSNAYETELRGDPNALNPNTPARKTVVSQLLGAGGATAGAFSDGVEINLIGGGANLLNTMQRVLLADTVVFPGESFLVQQLTAALALNVTFHGRFFRLGKEITA